MTDPVAEFFTEKFLNHFGAPDVVDPATFVAEYHKVLRGTEASILEEASEIVMRGHTFRNWPLIGECWKAVQDVVDRRASLRAALSPPVTDPYAHIPLPTPEQRAAVNALVTDLVADLKLRSPKRPR